MSSLKYAEPGSRPPSNAKRIYRWDDLPDAKGIERYIVNPNDANAEEIKLAKRKRQVLEGLMQGPIYAASYCRLSDQVMPSRRARAAHHRGASFGARAGWFVPFAILDGLGRISERFPFHRAGLSPER